MVCSTAATTAGTRYAYRVHLYTSRMGRARGAAASVYVRAPTISAILTGSIYSPAHALWWAIAGSLGMHAVTTWLVTAVLMTLFSVQAYFLSQEYTELVKDRSVISAEMLREYDEKVCAQDRAAVY